MRSMQNKSPLGMAFGGEHTLGCALARQTGQRSPLESLVWPDPAFATLRQWLLTPQSGTTAAAGPSTGSKDIITFQAEFGDWRKIVIGGGDMGTLAAGRNIHCVVVECEQDVPFR